MYKAKLIQRRAPWKTREAVELATLEWSCFNNLQLMAPLGYVPPAEFKANYYRNVDQQANPAWLKPIGLRESRGGSLQGIDRPPAYCLSDCHPPPVPRQ